MANRVKLENTNVWLICHEKEDCLDQVCSLHNRTPHHMRTWRQMWREDVYLMERVCEHSVGHPDPDDYTILYGGAKETHGCDGCCLLL